VPVTAGPLNREQKGSRDPHPAELTFVAAAQVAKFRVSRSPLSRGRRKRADAAQLPFSDLRL